AVRVVPPVVERRRGDHRERAPDADPRAERRAKSPEADGGAALRVRPGEGGPQRHPSAGQTGDDTAEIDGEVRRGPERIPADRAVPRDIPHHADDHTSRREEDGVYRPRNRRRDGGIGVCEVRKPSDGSGWSGHRILRYCPRRSSPMSMMISQSLLPEFDHEMANLRKTLERVPEDRPYFAPHPKSMPLARLAGHLAEMPMWATITVAQDEIDVAPPSGPSYAPGVMKTRQELLS